MQNTFASDRKGLFISHAHEDDKLAELFRGFLQSVLPDRAITCTSDAEYGMEPGADLTEQVHKRLDSAGALFLLATPAAGKKPWVLHECGYATAAAEKGELRFYVLSAIASHRDAVPPPYQASIAVNMSRAGEVGTFGHQLLTKFGGSPEAAAWRASAALVEFCARLERDDAEVHAALERDHLKVHAELEASAVKARYRRVQTQRNWLIAPALLGVVAVVVGVWMRNKAIVADAQRDAAQSSISLRDANERANYLRIRGIVIDQGDSGTKIQGARISATNNEQTTEPTESVEGGTFDLDIGGMRLKDNTVITLNVEKTGFTQGQSSFHYRQNLVEHTIALRKTEFKRKGN